MKPSLFTSFPLGSTSQNSETETIAQNIMIILSRTGDKFRPLSWEEYKLECEKDGKFSLDEKMYFDRVSHLSEGNIEQVFGFAPSWKTNKIIKAIDLSETL